MRVSVPMPLRTLSTSAPTRSHRLATSFMNEMRVASMALAAYLVSSAEAWSMTRIGLAGAHEGLVELAHDRLDLGVVRADHHPVGLEEVVDRRAFLQELGVGHHGERVRGVCRAISALHLGRRAHRHGRLVTTIL